MKHADIKAMMAEIAPVIREFTEAAVQPVMARLDALEKQLADLPAPRDGKDADEEAIAARVAEKTLAEAAALRAAVEASAATEMPDIPKMIEEAIAARLDVEDMERSIEDVVRSVVAEIPAPRDGEPGPKGEKGDAGTGVDSIDVNLIDDGATAVFTFTSGDTERSFEVPLPVGPRGADGEPGEPGAKGDPGEDGRDGLDVKDLFRADGGRLVAVMSDGTTKDLGVFVGKDGDKGKDGRDGFSLDDFGASLQEDGRTLVLSFDRGDQEFCVELAIPTMIYRGVWKDGEYRKGDTVTWGGSLWHCDVDETTEKPDSPEKHWTLAAKRGRDGKDGVLKPEAEKKPVRVG